MNCFLNPRIAPAYIAASAVALIGGACIISLDRLNSAAANANSAATSAIRAQSCRVLEGSEKLELGARYFQPAEPGSPTGQLLSEGEVLCDAFGSTGVIGADGYLRDLITGDAASLNESLMRRLDDKTNPDANPGLRPRRDMSQPLKIQPTQQETNNNAPTYYP